MVIFSKRNDFFGGSQSPFQKHPSLLLGHFLFQREHTTAVAVAAEMTCREVLTRDGAAGTIAGWQVSCLAAIFIR